MAYSPYGPCISVLPEKSGGPVGANNCPIYRRVFFPKQTAVVLPLMRASIELWDQAYACLGITLSKREHRVREDILQYLNGYFARGFDEYFGYYDVVKS